MSSGEISPVTSGGLSDVSRAKLDELQEFPEDLRRPVVVALCLSLAKKCGTCPNFEPIVDGRKQGVCMAGFAIQRGAGKIREVTGKPFGFGGNPAAVRRVAQTVSDAELGAMTQTVAIVDGCGGEPRHLDGTPGLATEFSFTIRM